MLVFVQTEETKDSNRFPLFAIRLDAGLKVQRA